MKKNDTFIAFICIAIILGIFAAVVGYFLGGGKK
jgi:hypothetical protein